MAVVAFDEIADAALRTALFARAERTTLEAALQALQRLLSVPQTGELDGVTISSLWKHDPALLALALANEPHGL